MQVEEFLECSAARFPDKLALIAGSRRVTYRDLDCQANRLAYSLVELGVRRGDRVAIWMDNSVEAVVALFASLKAGGVFVLLNPTTKTDKLIYLLNNCQASTVVCAHVSLSQLELQAHRLPHIKQVIVTGQLPEQSAQAVLNVVAFEQCVAGSSVSSCPPPNQNIDLDLAALIYTSASTGDSKGVMLSHLNIVSAATSITTYLENRMDDVILSMLPLSFDYGLYQVLMGFKVGGTVVLERSFSYPHVVLEKIAREKVTGLPLVPTTIAMLLEMDLSKYDCSSLRYLTSTAAVLPTQYINRLRALFPQVKIFSMYGLTECKRVSYLPPDQLDKRPASVGKGMPNQEMYLVDNEGKRLGPGLVGELVVRGSHVMMGYWGMPDATAQVLKPGVWPHERVLYTGDFFFTDEEGFYYFVGRSDDLIKIKGHKVSPREVENVLHGMKGIAEAAVVGLPDPILGQSLKAVIRLQEGVVIQAQDVLRHCAMHLEDYMVPKYVEIVKEFPKTDTGKINKRRLRLGTVSSPTMERTDKWLATGRVESAQVLAGECEGLRLEQIIGHTMDICAQKIAVVYRGREWTYAELKSLVAELKGRLSQAGLSAGDRAIVWMENSPEYIAAYLAVLEVGGVVVAIHSQVPAQEVGRVLSHVGAAGLVVSPAIKQWTPADFESTGLRFILNADEVIACHQGKPALKAPTGLAQIIYTSGSTGQPKGVMLSHKNLIANTKSILEYLHLTAADSVMAVLPFVYAYGNSVMLTHLFVGATLVIENSMVYPHVVLESMMKNGVTGLSGVSTTYAIMLNQSNLKSYAFPALRYLTHAGGPMPSELLSRLRSVFQGKMVFLMYGQTEASARLTYLPPDLLDVKKGTVGRAVSGVTLKVVKEDGEPAAPGEVGEVCASGDNIMQGYWQDPQTTAKVLQGGWLHTGDRGQLDGDNYLTIEGRNNEMIKSGAYRISPTEIEEVLLQHHQVQEAGVVGVDDPILGQKICAVVALKEQGGATAQDLLAHCAQRLVQYKRPKAIVIVAALPKSPSGKVLRPGLRNICLGVTPSAV